MRRLDEPREERYGATQQREAVLLRKVVDAHALVEGERTSSPHVSRTAGLGDEVAAIRDEIGAR